LWHLQIGTSDFTGLLLHLIRVPVLISGDRIILKEGLFQIIETCSGLRSIQTLALLAILMIDLFGRRGLHAIALLVLSPVVAFLINGLRCLGLIFNPHADIASIHSLQGIVMLLGGVLLLYFIDGLLAKSGPSPDRFTALERQARREARSRETLPARVGILVGFSAVLLAISWLPPFSSPAVALNSPANSIERSFEGWQSTELTNDWMFYGTTGFGQVLNRRYVRGTEQVELFIGQAGINNRWRSYLSPKAGYPGTGWITEREESTRIAGRDGTLRVMRKGAVRELVVTWFEASPGLARESARSLLALDSTAFAPRTRIPLAVRLSTPLEDAVDSAVSAGTERLERFAQHISPALQLISTPRESTLP
jgi:EpsI family protein